MELLDTCPDHGHDALLLMEFCYSGMTSSMKQLTQSLCQGDLLDKNPEEAVDFFAKTVEMTRRWEEYQLTEVSKTEPIPKAMAEA